MIREMGEHPEQYVRQPGRDFTRPRTLTFETVISLLLTMSENSIGKVLIGRFQNSGKTPSASVAGHAKRYFSLSRKTGVKPLRP